MDAKKKENAVNNKDDSTAASNKDNSTAVDNKDKSTTVDNKDKSTAVNNKDDSTDDGEPKAKRIKVNEVYKNCSEGTITFRVTNVSKELTFDHSTIYSQVEYINNIPWKIGTKCMPGRKLGVFLYLDDSLLGNDVEVYAEYYFSLVNQSNSVKTMSKPPRFDVVKSGTAYGDSMFITMDELLHSYNNFVVNNQAVFEAYVTCGNVISKKEKTDYLANRPQREKELTEYMSKRVNYIISNGIGSDCEIVFNKSGKEVVKRASKAFLARVSPVFEKMFFGNSSSKDRVVITNIEEEVFDSLLLHAYGGKWDVKSKERTVALYLASSAYEMKELQSVCMDFLWPRVLGDVWVFLYMSGKPELEHLKEAAVKVFARCASEGFISEQLAGISYESLADIVSQVALNVRSELEVFDGILRWSKAQCAKQKLEETRENLRKFAGKAFNMVRFLAMTHGEFESSPMLSAILSAEEKISILTRIIYKKKNTSLEQLCCLVKTRMRL